jgi:glyoxylase-like metal-dependent hydrolase (beta-lactamase superfamily II)
MYRNKFLFTGDHLAWSPDENTLEAYRDYCWWSWPEQIRSLERLLNFRFEWVLPGHGRIGHDSAERMNEHLSRLVANTKP